MTMKESTVNTGVKRRDVLMGALALAFTSQIQAASSSADKASEGHHHHHHSADNPFAEAIDVAWDCVAKGKACENHCIQLVKSGDTSIADCLDAVSEMMPICSAFAQLAASQSTHIKALAEVCLAICKDCEAACEVHKDKHAECKDCMESCAEFVSVCEKALA